MLGAAVSIPPNSDIVDPSVSDSCPKKELEGEEKDRSCFEIFLISTASPMVSSSLSLASFSLEGGDGSGDSGDSPNLSGYNSEGR